MALSGQGPRDWSPDKGIPAGSRPQDGAPGYPYAHQTPPPPQPYATGFSGSASFTVQLAPRPVTNGLAVAALVLGVVAAVLSLIPFVGPFLCWVPALLAIIFGFIGVATAGRIGGYRRGLAIAGIVCGFLPIPITLLGLFVLAGIASSSPS